MYANSESSHSSPTRFILEECSTRSCLSWACYGRVSRKNGSKCWIDAESGPPDSAEKEAAQLFSAMKGLDPVFNRLRAHWIRQFKLRQSATKVRERRVVQPQSTTLNGADTLYHVHRPFHKINYKPGIMPTEVWPSLDTYTAAQIT